MKTTTKNRQKAVKYLVYLETVIERTMKIMAENEEEAKELAKNRAFKRQKLFSGNTKVIDHEVVDVKVFKNESK